MWERFGGIVCLCMCVGGWNISLYGFVRMFVCFPDDGINPSINLKKKIIKK